MVLVEFTGGVPWRGVRSLRKEAEEGKSFDGGPVQGRSVRLLRREPGLREYKIYGLLIVC